MKTLFALTILTASLFVLNACTTREVATGAAAGAAGYVIGKEAND